MLSHKTTPFRSAASSLESAAICALTSTAFSGSDFTAAVRCNL